MYKMKHLIYQDITGPIIIKAFPIVKRVLN